MFIIVYMILFIVSHIRIVHFIKHFRKRVVFLFTGFPQYELTSTRNLLVPYILVAYSYKLESCIWIEDAFMQICRNFPYVLR